MKKVLQKLMVLLMLLASGTSYAYDFEVDGIYYAFSDDGLSVGATYAEYGNGSYYSGDIVIPDSVEWEGETYSVTSIGEYAFYECSGMTSVTIPNSVTTIGEYAFEFCSGLTSVTIGNSVTTIGWGAFYQCSSLTSVTIPNSVTTIGEYAFYECYGLTSVNINDIETWCKIAFGNWVSNPLTYAHNLYLNGELVTKIDIPDTFTTIGDYVFYGCSGLTSVTIPNSVTTIGKYAFVGCSGLTSVTIPNSVTTIGEWTFGYCSGLTSVTIGNSVTTIGDYVFYQCSGLTSVTIPNSVTTIGEYAFYGCSGLTSVNINDIEAWCKIAFGNEESNPLYHAHNLYLNGELVTEIDIPDTITTIGYLAFYGCSSLTSVTIPNSVTTIGDSAFGNCWNLRTLNTDMEFLLKFKNIGNYLESIENINIEGQPLVALNIPDEITEFPNWEFVFKCPSLKSVNTGNGITNFPDKNIVSNFVNSLTLGNSIKSLGGFSFPSVSLVMSHPASAPTIKESTFPQCGFGGDGVVIVDTPAIQTAYSASAHWEDLQISNPSNVAEVTVTTPGDLSFDLITQCGMAVAKVVTLKVNGEINADDFQQMKVNMKALMNIDLTDAAMTTVPASALAGKIPLSSIKLPSNCTTLEDDVFNGCINLSSVVINDKCESIGARAFYGCNELTDIVIPRSVVSINESAFANTSLKSVSLSNGLTTIGNYAFQNTSLSKVSLPNSVKTVGSYAFSGTGLSSIEFGRSLTSIGDYAFEGCNLTQVLELPEDLTTIGDGAFYGQEGITGHLTLYDKVASVGEGAFAGTSISSVFLSNKMAGINASTFAGCKNLDIVYLPDNIMYLGESAFQGCSGLTLLRLPSALDEIGARALSASGINSIKVPDSITEIQEGTFAQCQSLRSVSLPNGITTLEAESFNSCRALRNLSIKAVEPPTVMGASVFKGVNTDLCVLSIPTVSYREYVLADYWGQFIQMRNDIEVEVEGDGEITFDTVDAEDNEAPAETRRRAHALAAPRRSDAIAPADNGSTLYIPKNGTVNFYITPAENESILSATFDGRDILEEINDGVFTTTADKKSGKLVVKFSGDKSSLKTNVIDVEGEAVYYNLQGVRVDNPAKGIYIVGGKKVVVK